MYAETTKLIGPLVDRLVWYILIFFYLGIEVIENYRYLLKKVINPAMYTEQDYWQSVMVLTITTPIQPQGCWLTCGSARY